jgi:fucose permease
LILDKKVVSSLVGALLGAALLWWDPAPVVNLVAVGVIGFAIAPIFPGLVSGTGHRVGMRFAANTIGMQVAAGGLGAASLPSLMGILAQRTTLEVIPICLAVLIAVQIGLYWVSEINPPL